MRIPGPIGVKVFVGTSALMGFCAATFYAGSSNKSGHGAFDTEKPEAVQAGMEKKDADRLSRLSARKL